MVASESVEEVMDDEDEESSSSPLLVLLSVLTSFSSWWFSVDLLVDAPDNIPLTSLVVGRSNMDFIELMLHGAI